MKITHKPLILETIINEESKTMDVSRIQAMTEEQRVEFFSQAASSLLAQLLVNLNEGNTWAVLQVKETE